LTGVAGEAFRNAVAFVVEQCPDPADPVTVVTMQGYLVVSRAFQCGFALVEEWMSEKASDHRGWRWGQVGADKVPQIAE
jgi:hypothetical protein